ncbi:MAG: hypothetical protein QM770_06890 [Tepidisphaeraceae bacterium]
MALSLQSFAAATDEVAGTPGKLAKQARLAELFRSCDDESLPLAVRFSDGRAFARTDERVIGVSGALLMDVVLPILGFDYSAFRPLALRHGEVGNAIGEAWRERSTELDALTLPDVQASFDQLAAVTAPDAKREILASLWQRVRTPREAAVLAKVMLNDLRTGVKEGVLIPAVAKAFERDEADVRRALLLTGDLDSVALLAQCDRLGEARFTLFHPIQFMLAGLIEAGELRVNRDTGRPDVDLSSLQYPLAIEPKLDGIRASPQARRPHRDLHAHARSN